MNSEATRLYYEQNPAARMIVLLVVCISAFLTPLALSATLVAVPAIAIDLHTDAVYASWIPAVFLLSNMIALLPVGRLADIHGRKRMFMAGNLVFIVGCLLAGLAQSIEALLFYRVIQGVGAAMFFSTGIAIISSVFKGFGRGAALGWVVASVYTGLSVGPLLGGWLTDQISWHAVFFVQVPLALVGLLFGVAKMKGEWRTEQAPALDWPGTVLLALWLLPFFIGVGRLANGEGLVWLLLAAVFFGLFLRHTRRVPNPIIRLGVVWENRIFSRSLVASLLMYAANYGLVFLMGLYLQYNRGMMPTEAGQMLVLQAMMMALMAPVAGRLSDRYSARNLAALGCGLFALCLLVVTVALGADTSLYLLGGCLLLMGLGFALFSTPNNNVALGAVSEERLGIASALLTMGRLMGQMFGTAVVTLLMAWFIGNHALTVEHYPALLLVVRCATGLSMLFALTAAIYSLERG